MQRAFISKLKSAEHITSYNIFKLLGIILLKLAAAYITGIGILYTSALKTFSTIVSLFAGWIGIKASERTADKHFEYGYYKIETFAAFLASTFILYVGLQILIESIREIIIKEPYNFGFLGVIVVIIAMALSWQSSKEIAKAAKEANLSSLLTSANFKKIDSIAYIGILIGAFTAIFGIPYVEPILSGAIALWILWIALKGFQRSLFSLLDYWRDVKMLNKVRKLLHSYPKIVDKIEQVKLRQAGPLIFGEAILKINSFANVKDVRNATFQMRKKIIELSPYIQDFAIYTNITCPDKTLVAIPVKSGSSMQAKLAHSWSDIKHLLLIEIRNSKAKVTGQIPLDKTESQEKLAQHLVSEKVNVFMWGRIDSLTYYTLERINQIQVYPSFANAKTVDDAIKLFTIDS